MALSWRAIDSLPHSISIASTARSHHPTSVPALTLKSHVTGLTNVRERQLLPQRPQKLLNQVPRYRRPILRRAPNIIDRSGLSR